MKNLFKLGLIASAMVAANAVAEEKEAAPELKVSAELGILITTGNTESSSYLGKLSVDQELENWRNVYKLDFLQKKSEVDGSDGNKVTEETDNRWTGSAEGKYKFTDNFYVFKSQSYGGVPLYFTKSDDKKMSIEHTHPPSEYIFMGDRNYFQKLKKKYCLSEKPK